MLKHSIFSLFLLLIFITQPQLVLAKNAGVECVQNQLVDLDIDVGVADGLIGPKTVDGLRKLVQQEPELAKFKRLTNFNSLMWCRAIAGSYSDTKAHWPTQKDHAFKYSFAGTLAGAEQAYVENAMSEARRYFKDRGVDIPGIVNVVASDELEELAQLMAQNSFPKRSISSTRRVLKRHCSDRKIGGLNSNGLIVFCFSEDLKLADEFERITDVAVHELAHEIQRQVTGYASNSIRTEEQWMSKYGPRWLVEATASAFEHDYSKARLKGEILIAYLRFSQKHFSGEKLAGMEFSKSVFSDDFAPYVTLAGQLLAKGEGLDHIMTYWEYMVHTDWQTSFDLAFGKSLADFHEEFDWKDERLASDHLTYSSARPTADDVENVYVACIQRHLKSANIAVGTVDGILGPQTRAGLRQFTSKWPELLKLGNLTNQNAPIWCSQIGQLAHDAFR